MRLQQIQHEFVEFVPEKLESGRLYISIPYATATHLCCCGCGYEVTNPITPTDWSLHFNGDSVSLTPSIGNSSFPCRSHYWIRNNRVYWEARMTPGLTKASRARDQSNKGRRYGIRDARSWEHNESNSKPENAVEESLSRGSLFDKLRKLFR